MAKTPLSLKSKDAAKDTIVSAEPEDSKDVFEPLSQKRRPDMGRYRLQVDRQTKSSYDTFDEAEKAGLRIKKQFSQVRVAIYDAQESTNTVLVVPA